MKSTIEIRNIFLNYFVKKNYTIIDSSSLIPKNDNSILFTNAGMNQFKDFFIGQKYSKLDKIATIQRCLRAGGKHNDLEEVGYTSRHHTFFEMLGNFSFGKLTKEEIITDIWEILTTKDQFDISPDRLVITVNKNDTETYNVWHRLIGLNKNKIVNVYGENFWQMSEIGPCGPSTEIFYDLKQSNYSSDFINNPDCFLEICNIVFMQYYKSSKNISDNLEPLNNLCIDTGIGLERLASILQGVNSNYNIDCFKNLINIITTYINVQASTYNGTSFNVLADHIRAIIFLINEGLQPSHEGRGYVLRRIIRRAIRHGRYLGLKQHFLYKLVEPCLEQIQVNFNKLIFVPYIIKQVVQEEEERFTMTLDRGMKKLLQVINNLPSNVLSGKVACNLYETYGFPFDLTKEICKEKNIIINDNDLSDVMKCNSKG